MHVPRGAAADVGEVGGGDPRAQPRRPPLARHLQHRPGGRPDLRQRGPLPLRRLRAAEPVRQPPLVRGG
ncbi:hypothetical protein MUK42_12570 [Musa troglodytarum]|nr:hypothetical protein MUK42_12570 [Musa troglodytarum]